MPIYEHVSSDLVLYDSKIRIETALDGMVSRIQVHYGNKIVVKLKKDWEFLMNYWVIVERIPVKFLNFTLWHKNRIIVRTDCPYMCGSILWDIYDRKIAEIAIDEINKLSAHYPRVSVNVTKHFRPLSTEPGHLIAGDALL